LTIENYFLEYTNTYHEMKKALKRYINAKDDYHHLTGKSADEYLKSKNNHACHGIDDLLANIEQLQEEYLELSDKYKKLRKKYNDKLHKLENTIYRIILEYAYLDFDKDKKILKNLKEYHNETYSFSHFRKLKGLAIKEFEEMIQNDTKWYKMIQFDTK